MRRPLLIASAIGLVAAATLPALAAQTPKPFDPVAPGRETEPIILTGANFAGWAAPEDLSAKAPSVNGKLCTAGQDQHCTHNQYEDPDASTGAAGGEGVPIDKLIGYRWDTKHGWRQIPFQVDEMATRYLSNNISGFAFYSETDQHVSYVFDEERFNWTAEDPANPCRAVPRDGKVTTPDTVPGLDTNDELVFMARDAGPQAPADAELPRGIVEKRTVVVTDPFTGKQSYAYVMRSGDTPGAPKPHFDAENGYVRYLPDADSDTFLFSESSYEDYGNTYRGAWLDEATGVCVTNDPKQHRPKDTAWIKTPTYAFRFEGRWRLTETRVATPAAAEVNAESENHEDWLYGPDLVDQWKARAFQQRPGGETPCCGYEEEDNNWGGSSMLMGWRAGPVRVIRATWGADSSTNNLRTEVFYRDEMRQLTNLRVHVIPPFDGIYAQWDFNAGKVTRYSNPFVPEGVKVDGKNDEVFGNGRMHVSQNGVAYQSDDKTGVAPVDEAVNKGVVAGSPSARCPNDACVNNDIDTVDPTFSGPLPSWEQIGGPFGTFVDRLFVKQVNGGAAYTLVTTPYYRDDSCFDDGTGTDPGIRMRPRAVDPDIDSAGNPRECWEESDGDPLLVEPRDHFYQGDIGTHGIHILLIAESDNATVAAPLNEIAGEFRRVILPGDPGNVGEVYGRGIEKPLAVVVTP